jgi:hypothetical protein
MVARSEIKKIKHEFEWDLLQRENTDTDVYV